MRPTDRDGWDGWSGHDHVAPVSQYASPDLVLEFASGRRDPTDDPRWRSSGAPTPQDYGAWASRICGLACLRTVLRHWEVVDPGPWALVQGCSPYGVYDADGPSSPGLRYRPFLAYLEAEHGITGQVIEDRPTAALRAGPLSAGGFLIWSVHFSIRQPSGPAPGTPGGHLVLVHGYDREAGTVAFCNPSGHDQAARAARLPIDVFERFAAPRGMALDPR